MTGISPIAIHDNIDDFAGEEQRAAMHAIADWIGFEKYPTIARTFNTFVASQVTRASWDPQFVEEEWVFDGTSEGEFDVFAIDVANNRVFVQQGKARESSVSESKKDAWGGFILQALSLLQDSSEDFDDTLNQIGNAELRKKLRLARKYLKDPEWVLHICFATLGTVGEVQVRQAIETSGMADRVDLDVITIHDIDAMLNDRANPHAEPVWKIRVTAIGQYIETTYPFGSRNPSLLVAQVPVLDLVRQYKRHREALFEANVRGYLGHRAGPASQMISHIYYHPESFHLMHNGVTVIASKVEKDGPQDATEFALSMPSIVNGQQTIRTLTHLAEDGWGDLVPKTTGKQPSTKKQLERAQVVLKIVLKNQALLDDYRDNSGVSIEWNRLSQEIAYASNHQTAIDHADLRSNDAALISWFERLRGEGLYLQRKRMVKPNLRKLVTMEERHRTVGGPLDNFDANTVSTSICALAPGIGAFSGKYGKKERFGKDPFRRKDRKELMPKSGPGSTADTISLFQHVFSSPDIEPRDMYLMTLIHEYVRSASAEFSNQELLNTRSAVARLIWGAIDSELPKKKRKALLRALRRERFEQGLPVSVNKNQPSPTAKDQAVIDNLNRLVEKSLDLLKLRWQREKSYTSETIVNFYKNLPGTKWLDLDRLATEKRYSSRASNVEDEVAVLIKSL